MNANDTDLIDEAFGLLEHPRRGLLDCALAATPGLAERQARLQQAIRRLVDDGEDPEPPADLAARTLSLVAEHRRRPRRSILDFAPARVPFRWADVAVAAGIFVAALSTLAPAVQKSRARAAQVGCAWNLQRLGVALNQYAGAHGSYPYVDPHADAPYAGTFAVLLKDRGYLDDPSCLTCPPSTSSTIPTPLPDYSTLAAVDRHAPRSAPCLRNVSYGYNLGYRRQGRPGPIPVDAPGTVPLLADRPGYSNFARILDGNSPNHNGSGQNVLFADGHVGFYSTRRLGPTDDDMFLNALRRPAPGLHDRDAVLAPGIVRFDGL